ncbi:MAG: hypothetical protein KIT84_22905 [Labilithrix sp.]|nr:hypothetical protein [Labilithrix sp.]MCW5813895.1 hypothetical protein [Labilithrix sp.]
MRSWVVVFVVALVGCARTAPPTPVGIDAAVAPLPGPIAATAAGEDASASASLASADGDGDAGGAADAAATAASIAALLDSGVDPGTLPQTKDRPAPSSPALDARAATLWDAIVNDDPDRGMPFFFPVTAYEQVKAISHASADWRRRLVSAYKRDIHGLAKRLGDKASSAKMVRFEVPDERARWVDVDEEYNKLGYYRVFGSKIVYEIDGKERTFEISSLISWRGEWYVVHLTGFK